MYSCSTGRVSVSSNLADAGTKPWQPYGLCRGRKHSDPRFPTVSKILKNTVCCALSQFSRYKKKALSAFDLGDERLIGFE